MFLKHAEIKKKIHGTGRKLLDCDVLSLMLSPYPIRHGPSFAERDSIAHPGTPS